MQYTNDLIHELSPYLLQHAHNPVHWYPWGQKAFSKAAKENKMIIISIGYAACHWCHVMEHESFENEDVAAIMNEHFVCIKVDREERPDVDMIYMNAAQLIHGNGGWPLNALALPDGRPVFAATYFPADRWVQLLKYFSNEFQTNPKDLEEQAAQLSAGIVRVDHMPRHTETHNFSGADAREVRDKIIAAVDKEYGGLSSNVKFPMPSVWEWLLKYHYLTQDEQSLQAVTQTLNWMMNGGIYDHLGGGFARYATDRQWHVPHFEKMLYDNVQLISLYSHAFQVTKEKEYGRIIRETVNFIRRELYDGQGFFSSLDADSEKEEGKFYVWTYDDIHRILKEDAHVFCDIFGITPQGNWEDGKNILDKNPGNRKPEDPDGIEKWKSKLLSKRAERTRPALDDKVITAWNAMACSSLTDAWRALEEKDYLELSEKNLNFIIDEMWDEKECILYRNYKAGKRSVYGFLDDYAFLMKACIDYYQTSFKKDYLDLAVRLLDITLAHFHNPDNDMFFYNDTRFNELISRPSELSDGVIPSSTSVMAENLFRIGTLYDDRRMLAHSGTMVKNMKGEILSQPAYQSYWSGVMLHDVQSTFEVAIMGENFAEKLHVMLRNYLPFTIFCGSASEENLPLLKQKHKAGNTLIYVCQDKTCQQPLEKASDALRVIKPLLI